MSVEPDELPYYNPSLSPDERHHLERRNYLVLMAGQAALGLIGPDVVGLAIEPIPGGLVLHVAALRRTAAMDEDLADLVADLEGYLWGGPEANGTVTLAVHEGQADHAWPGRAHALIFMAKA